jgi:signal transduction histidine kinase
MKRKFNIFIGIIIAVFAVLWYMDSKYMPILYRDSMVVLCGIGIVAALFLLNRFIIFRKKMDLAISHILENNFRTGISLEGNDEISFLAKRFNAAIDRINEYDRLREHKIGYLNRLITTLSRNIQNGVMILDMETAKIKINKAAQEIFNVGQDELSIDSVIKLQANEKFNNMYQEIVGRRANTIADDLDLYLPILKAKAAVNVKMFAIKDKEEKLNSILCILRSNKSIT